MRTTHCLLAALTFAAAGIHASENKAGASVDSQAAFARLKSLAGEWEASTSSGKAHLSYEVIAGGTSIVERDTAEKMPGMLTVYHMDGARLMLEHYCMAGNQPRMEARAYDPQTGELRFEFAGAANLASKDAGHMHNVTFRLTGSERLDSKWEFYEGGKLKFAENFEYTRVK